MPDGGRYRRAAALGVTAVAVAVAVSIPLLDSRGASSDLRGARGVLPPAASSASSSTSSPSPSIGKDGVPSDAGTQIAALLTQRGTAVMKRSRAAWLATVDPRAATFTKTQKAVFGRIVDLTPQSWSYIFQSARPLPSQQATTVPGGWIAKVDLVYRLASGGPDVKRHQYLVIAPAKRTSTSSTSAGPGNWLIASDSAGPTEPDLWDLSPIQVTRSSRCVVIGSTSWTSLSARVASSCPAAGKRVDGVWGKNWPRRTVVIVPTSQKQLGVLLNRTSVAASGLTQTAAITIGPATTGAEEVLVNPAVFKQFPQLGIRVILTHEFVHVATRATGSVAPPTWLSEGFADYVGFTDSGLSPRDIAGDALAEVDKGRIPAKLPPNIDFDASRKSAPAAYGFGWALVKTIAREGGTKKVVAFYKAASANGPGTADARVDAAVTSVLGYQNTKELITRWQRELRTLAR